MLFDSHAHIDDEKFDLDLFSLKNLAKQLNEKEEIKSKLCGHIQQNGKPCLSRNNFC